MNTIWLYEFEHAKKNYSIYTKVEITYKMIYNIKTGSVTMVTR